MRTEQCLALDGDGALMVFAAGWLWENRLEMTKAGVGLVWVPLVLGLGALLRVPGEHSEMR